MSEPSKNTSASDREANISIKEDMNFLEYPSWTINETEGPSKVVIERQNGYYELNSSIQLPTRTDKIFLYYLINQILEIEGSTLRISKYKIIKNTFGTPSKAYYDMLDKALDKWAAVWIKFKGLFYSGDGYTDRTFHILAGKKETEGSHEIEIYFDNQFLEQLRNSKYYKMIDFNEYKKLRKPLAARLYELLIKNFSTRSVWKIEVMGLCEKLTLKKKFPSQALQKLEPALNEINSGTDLKVSLQTIKNRSDQTICIFKKASANSFSENASIEEIVSVIPPRRRTESVIGLIKAYRGDKEHLMSNLLYSMEKATRNFPGFLRMALKYNWAGNRQAAEQLIRTSFANKIQSFESIVREVTGSDDDWLIRGVVTTAISKNQENGFSDDYLDEKMFREFAGGIWRNMNQED